jgi:flagellar biogenesis protein FliO
MGLRWCNEVYGCVSRDSNPCRYIQNPPLYVRRRIMLVSVQNFRFVSAVLPVQWQLLQLLNTVCPRAVFTRGFTIDLSV